MINFIIGIFTGSAITVIVVLLLAMAKDTELPKHEPEQNESTILWTKGNLCKWKRQICEITDFSTRVNNDTIALIEWENNGCNYRTWVPIEELEAVEE